MLWLIVAVSAYLIFALVALGDKYLLAGPLNPKGYSFYVGVLGILFLALAPFFGFSLPGTPTLILALLAGAIYIFALLGLYTGLEKFEASRVVPAIGGLLPLFTFSLVLLSSGGGTFSFRQILSFILLLSGSIFITLGKEKGITFESFKISAFSAFLFSLSFVLAKYVFLSLAFWPGFFWMRIGGFLAALGLFFVKEARKEIFDSRPVFEGRRGIFLLFNQGMAGIASVLQNWAIALVPLAFLPFVNALEGVKYVFLLIFAAILSFKFPKILKEEISQKVVFRKIAAILLIGGGLLLLAL